jgi:hypothetical protein
MTKTAYGINLCVITFFALNGIYFARIEDNPDMAMVFFIPTLILLLILPKCSIEE